MSDSDNIRPPEWTYAEAREHLRRLAESDGSADFVINYLAGVIWLAHGRGISVGLQVALGVEMGEHELPVDLRFIKGSESLQ